MYTFGPSLLLSEIPEIHTHGPRPPDDDLIHNLIKKKETSGGQGQGGQGVGGGGSGGGGWKIWDQQTHLFSNSSLTECRWTEYRVVMGQRRRRRSSNSSGEIGSRQGGGEGEGEGGRLPMCVHKEPDMVSKSIIQRGRWDDCDLLVNMWRSIEEEQEQQTQAQTQTLVHLEVGANIGACVMQLLMATSQVQILAFEPNPRNLYCLTATLSGLPVRLKSRVNLFPIGLGSAESEQQIYAEIGNNGNSVVGLETKYRPGVQYHPAVPIFIERLDDILDLSQLGENVVGGGGVDGGGDSHKKNTNTNTAAAAAAAKIRIGVMKLDVQGYECFALEGMTETLAHIDKIKFEADERLLKPLGCSFELMSQTFEKSGFKITDLIYTIGHLLRVEHRTRLGKICWPKNNGWP